jgi:hypothetical protein
MLGLRPLSYPSDQDILTKRTVNCTSRSDDNFIAILLKLLKCFYSGQSYSHPDPLLSL